MDLTGDELSYVNKNGKLLMKEDANGKITIIDDRFKDKSKGYVQERGEETNGGTSK